MQVREKIVLVRVTGSRGDGVKTIHGCEDVFLDPPGGAVILFFGKLLGFGPLFFVISPRKKSIYTFSGGP